MKRKEISLKIKSPNSCVFTVQSFNYFILNNYICLRKTPCSERTSNKARHRQVQGKLEGSNNNGCKKLT